MALTSGFFEAMYDSEAENWDRVYLAEQFANYFRLFIGNGVFASPTNQLKIIPGVGLSVMISPGWAFINGYWCHVDTNESLIIAANQTAIPRTDTIVLRMSQIDRSIEAFVLTGSTEIVRGDNTYDIALAYVNVLPSAVVISDSNITDKRGDATVCGFVTGLLKVETTEDLYSQLEGQFNDWFQTVKDQVTGDLAIRLQQEFIELNQNVEDYTEEIKRTELEYKQAIDESEFAYKTEVTELINGYNENYSKTLNEAKEAAQASQDLVDDLVARDYVIPERTFNFVNNVCNISDRSVTETTLLDLYFTQDCIDEVVRCEIYILSEEGNIKIIAERTPRIEIKGTIGVRVR